jgi:rRNA maturation RNase YbeY
MDTSVIDIKTTIRGSVPRIPFREIAQMILGTSYELSLVICGDALATRMYKEHRLPSLKLRQASNKTYSPNVLSFPLDKNEGEIFLNVRKAQREARAFGIPLRERLAYLYIHGCFHLKGLDHSDKMEREEARVMKRFGLG